MLSELKIENVAVIEKAQAHFDRGLNVLTGETGAGKSILIDSINAILGNRASRDLVRTGAAKAAIWATFTQLPPSALAKLENAGYETDDALLLYREISAEGKSSCRINGMPATAAVLRDICADLLTIHGQHDSQSLTNPAKHIALLDTYAQNSAAHQAYYKKYRELITVKRQMDALSMDEAQRQQKIETLRFQVEEIANAKLKPGEEEALQERRRVASHAQTILEQLAAAQSALAGGDEVSGAADLLGSAAGCMDYAGQLDKELAPYAEKLNELYYTARELAGDLAASLESYSFDPGELEMIESRLDLIYRLKQKYGSTEEEIIAFGERAEAELETIESSADQLQKLNAQMRALYREARELANILTKTRLDGFEQMNREITGTLQFLNMPGIRFVLRHSVGALAGSGQDTVEFLISANRGEEPRPLAKIASGGELSRIMLAIKSALAEKDSIATVIYDEIDTGVSGSAAGRIGQVLKQTSTGRQVLCITHTAQIAALADEHLLIQKNVEGDRTYTSIRQLDSEQRVHEIARIISGDNITETSLANAREMLGQMA